MALFELDELAAWVQSTPADGPAIVARDAAVAYLEGEVGVRLTEQTGTVTYTVRWDDCWIDLPVPTSGVDSVTVDGSELAASEYQVVENRLYRRVGWGGSRWLADDRFPRSTRYIEDDYTSVAVTLTYGFPDGQAPGELKTWGLVLASQALMLAPHVGKQSERIDDYSVTFYTGGGQYHAGVGLPPKVLGKLKAKYGRRNATVVNAR